MSSRSTLLRHVWCAPLVLGLFSLSSTSFAQDDAPPPAEVAPGDEDKPGPYENGAEGDSEDAEAEAKTASEPPAPKVPVSDKARKHFRAGVAYLQDPDGARYDEAYLEFKAAYADSPAPKILGNVGLCAMKMERVEEAIEAYTTYLEKVPDIPDAERAQIESDVEALISSAVKVTVTVNVPGVSLVDTRQPIRGFPVTNTYGPIERSLTLRIKPGKHEIIAKREGYEDHVWTLRAGPADVQVYAFNLEKIVPVEPVQPVTATDVVPWVLVGLGVAAGAAAAVTGTIALNTRSDIQAECPNDTCPFASDLDQQRDKVKTYGLATDILIGSAAASALAGVLWLVIGSGDSTEEVGALGVDVSASCGPYGCAAAAKVDF